MIVDSNAGRKHWHVVELEVDGRQEELAGWLFMQLGANGCEVTAGGGTSVRVRATFEPAALPGADTTRIAAALDEYGLNNAVPSLRVSELHEEDWLAKWKQGFEPFAMGERLLICPLWDKDNLSPAQRAGRQVVLIEPGLAFGTGFHETTQFCLLALQDYIDSAACVLDIGSGSGILSIACALLNGKARIIALENDPVACKNAAENLEANDVLARIEMIEGTTESLLKERDRVSADLVLANLTYEDHAALISDYIALTQPGGHLIFAGILKEKAALMRELLTGRHLEIVCEQPGDKWVGFAVRRNP